MNWQDYGARYYNPEIGRFTTVDPLADWTPSYSTYLYTFNNPLNYNDPTGIPKVLGGKGMRVAFIKTVGRFTGRMVSFVGWGFLAFDRHNFLYYTSNL